MAEITPPDRALAIAELDRIEQTLSAMSRWADSDTADREPAAIALEDAVRCVMATAYLLERADRGRVADLVHRRLSRAPDSTVHAQGRVD